MDQLHMNWLDGEMADLLDMTRSATWDTRADCCKACMHKFHGRVQLFNNQAYGMLASAFKVEICLQVSAALHEAQYIHMA